MTPCLNVTASLRGRGGKQPEANQRSVETYEELPFDYPLPKDKDSPRTRGEDGIHQRPFFKKQYSNSIGMVGTNITSIAETFRLSTVHDLPNIVSGGKTNLRPMVREELFPVILENPLKSEMAFADGFHNGLNPTSIPDSATNYYCPEGAFCSRADLKT
uniref:Uncharacterized protein n=1 Tax=Candidatus Kentrum sp. TC TaxID=2126339 RepID=A0A450YV73_9GAMM|nr:MAG: hypothetical protein BECKTC1821E_GA0114239_10496 [Candidatus Kentron sp. TC]